MTEEQQFQTSVPEDWPTPTAAAEPPPVPPATKQSAWRKAPTESVIKPLPLLDGSYYRLFGISTICLGSAAKIATWLLDDFRTDKSVLFPFLVVGFLALIMGEIRAARSDAIQIHLRQKL